MRLSEEKKIVNDQTHKTILSLRWIAQTLHIQCARDNDVNIKCAFIVLFALNAFNKLG